MRWQTCVVLVLALALVWGCRKRRRSYPGRARPDASVMSSRRGPAVAAPRPVPVTAAQRAFDRQHRAALLQIVGDLDALYKKSVALQARGVKKPATQDNWPTERERLLSHAGAVRVKVLAVDPLSNRSWATARAAVLLRYLTVKLPDAIRESWRTRPSGAFATWGRDFRLIWGRLRRYVKSQLKKPHAPRSKDTK